MLNQCVLVGRIESEKIKEIIRIKVPRYYKNSEGEYDSDIIPILISGALLDNVREYCKKGDLIGIKGRIENKEDEIVIITEKVTFLSEKKENE